MNEEFRLCERCGRVFNFTPYKENDYILAKVISDNDTTDTVEYRTIDSNLIVLCPNCRNQLKFYVKKFMGKLPKQLDENDHFNVLTGNRRGMYMTDYTVVTLCGSTKFKDEFIKAEKKLTLEGYIVLSVGLFGHSGDNEVWDDMEEGTYSETKAMLDDMHKRKIDMSDEIFVINPGGYIGESTRDEIEYAMSHGKKVKYLVNKEEEI